MGADYLTDDDAEGGEVRQIIRVEDRDTGDVIDEAEVAVDVPPGAKVYLDTVVDRDAGIWGR